MKVQIWLRCQKIVQVILLAAGVPLPGAAAKNTQPVVGRVAVIFGVCPDIPVRLGVVTAGTAFYKPRVLVGAVRQHLVDHHLEPQVMRTLQQLFEIGHVAEHRVNIAVIAHIVAKILHRTFEKGRQPNGVNTQLGHIVQT